MQHFILYFLHENQDNHNSYFHWQLYAAIKPASLKIIVAAFCKAQNIGYQA